VAELADALDSGKGGLSFQSVPKRFKLLLPHIAIIDQKRILLIVSRPARENDESGTKSGTQPWKVQNLSQVAESEEQGITWLSVVTTTPTPLVALFR
jgi:hypothetical protein